MPRCRYCGKLGHTDPRSKRTSSSTNKDFIWILVNQGNLDPDPFAHVDLQADGDLSSVNSSRRVESLSTQSGDEWSTTSEEDNEDCNDDFNDDNQDFELGYESALACAQQEHHDRMSEPGDRGASSVGPQSHS